MYIKQILSVKHRTKEQISMKSFSKGFLFLSYYSQILFKKSNQLNRKKILFFKKQFIIYRKTFPLAIIRRNERFFISFLNRSWRLWHTMAP